MKFARTLIGLTVIALLLLLLWGLIKPPTEVECKTDEDCVPAQCCHPTSCIGIENQPNCERVFCTLECRPGTMDCGQGHCACVNNKCQVVWTP